MKKTEQRREGSTDRDSAETKESRGEGEKDEPQFKKKNQNVQKLQIIEKLLFVYRNKNFIKTKPHLP